MLVLFHLDYIYWKVASFGVAKPNRPCSMRGWPSGRVQSSSFRLNWATDTGPTGALVCNWAVARYHRQRQSHSHRSRFPQTAHGPRHSGYLKAAHVLQLSRAWLASAGPLPGQASTPSAVAAPRRSGAEDAVPKRKRTIPRQTRYVAVRLLHNYGGPHWAL